MKQFSFWPEKYRECVDRYDEGCRGEELSSHLFFASPRSIDDLVVLSQFVAKQEVSQLATDLGELLVVSMDLHAMRDAQLMFIDIKHRLGVKKIQDLDCLDNVLLKCVMTLKDRLDEYEYQMLGTISLFYGVSGESDPLVKELSALLKDVKASEKPKNKKRDKFLSRAQELNTKWKVRCLSLLGSLGGFMSVFNGEHKTIVNKAIGRVGGKHIYSDVDEDEQKLFCVYAWRYTAPTGDFVKIGITSSAYETLMSTRLKNAMSFQEYDTSLALRVSSSRIHQVARCLRGGVERIQVLAIKGPCGTRREATAREKQVRNLFVGIPPDEMRTCYIAGQSDGHTEFVEWKDGFVDKFVNELDGDPPNTEGSVKTNLL